MSPNIRVPNPHRLEAQRKALLKSQADKALEDSKGKFPPLPEPPKARERAWPALPAPAPMPVSFDTASTINMETEMRTVLRDALEKGKREQAIAAEARGHLITPRPPPRLPRGTSRPVEPMRKPTPALKRWHGLTQEQWIKATCAAIIGGAVTYVVVNLLTVHS